MTGRVYALLIDATAGSNNEHPEGEKHYLLVLVSADDADDAAAEAMIALTEKRWTGGLLKQAERFGVPLGSVTDPVLREAAKKAFAGHRSIVVYGKA